MKQERTEKKDKKKEKRCGEPFELCKVCNLNHDQGYRHKYFPSHVKSLSSLLSRFQKKLSDLRFFLRNPTPLRPEHSSLNRLWCVFCDQDIDEIDSSFACSNAINHLASSEHFRNLKGFLWKHGGDMERVDLFRVSEADLVKWEKSCRSLKSAAFSSSEGTYGPLPGPSKDIQNELTSNNNDNFDKDLIHSYNSTVSHTVMPLQSPTNEGYWICHPEVSGATNAAPTPYVAAPLLVSMQRDMGLYGVHVMGSAAEHLAVGPGSQPKVFGNSGKGSVGCSGVVRRTDSGEDCNQVLQNFTQISSLSEACQANVHSGAPAPWLDASEENERNRRVNEGQYMINLPFPSAQTTKLRKLNPKRVGAAWADKRRVELEMEKRGVVVADSCDANWLPNFGRVWQAGTRKESRKEFEMEKRRFLEDASQSEIAVKLQPYISKRMRNCSPENDGTFNGHVEAITKTL